ncbi:SCO family protein [Luteolibacter marinus]|uniref:SCO family protein n=1 Tax=Luteolibacter marinus TaxID=2776705 RepID=UPI001867E7EA
MRDPRKLRKTALWLVLIMIASGIGIFAAYVKWGREQIAKQAEHARPGIVGRIDDKAEFGVVRQDASGAKISDLFGKVWVVCGVAVNQPESWETTREVLLRLNERYAGRDDFRIVCFTVDPEHEQPAVLARVAAELGVDLPKWWFAAAGQEYVHKFLKNKLKLEQMPHQVDGKWLYDSSVVLVDRDRHIRRAVVPQKRGGPPYVAAFNFAEARDWDGKGIKTGNDRSNVGQLEFLLIQTIDELLAQPVTP